MVVFVLTSMCVVVAAGAAGAATAELLALDGCVPG